MSSTSRTKELFTVAYFLSRCGRVVQPNKPHGPPPQLQVSSWRAAYEYFYEALADGRSHEVFFNTLKASRDQFDGHVDSGRKGWREPGPLRQPQPLDEIPGRILSYWATRSDEELWATVRSYVHPPSTPTAHDMDDALPGRVPTTTYRILRDTELARRVKRMHNCECQICGHAIVLPDGSRYAEAHHIQPLGRPHNGPDVIGNILCLCPNHHAELDYGVRALSLASLSSVDGHELDPRFAEYHNRKIHGGRNEAALDSAGAI